MALSRPLLIGYWSLSIVGWMVIAPWSFAAEISKPLSPDEEQKAFVLADASLRIELVAAEPQIVDPVAIRFDEDGRIWVAEMIDYPLGNPSGGEPLSRIQVLEDKDGDGRFETATTFAGKLPFVTGLQPWKGGVFVTLSGRLAYMKDTDGDGKADVDETWFEGFAEQNSQLRANHPRLALDNWIYVANGLRGGQVVNKKLGETKPINISGMDFRFHPITGVCEAISGNGQFGLCFDDWGNRFNVSNRNPVKHVVIEDRYLKANPNVTVPATVNDVAAFGEQSRIFPISRAWTTSNLHAGQFTAACGVYIYRGNLLPAEFKGNTFTCDPTGNLIHREIMQPAGPTFTSKPAYDGKEFLASPHEWFRPVNMELGPDGALYVVDMYRCVIEHPDFVPEELKKRPDLRLGDDRGRIWRIVPAEYAPKQPRRHIRPDNYPLFPMLAHPNAWYRETAQRLVLERGELWEKVDYREPGVSREDELRKIIAQPTSSSIGRAHALWVLAGVGKITTNDCKVGMSDSDPRVRCQAVRVAEMTENASTLKEDIQRLCMDADARVRYQARLTASLNRPNQAMTAEYALRDAEDAWMRQSVLLYAGQDQAGGLVSQILKGNATLRNAAPSLTLVEDLSFLSAKADSNFATQLNALALIDQGQPALALAALRGAAKGMTRSSAAVTMSEPFVERLSKLARDENAQRQDRIGALSLLGFAPAARKTLAEFVSKTQTQPIRLAALGALSKIQGDELWGTLLDGFASDTPPIRRAIIDGLLANADRTKLLLDAIDAGKIKPNEIDTTQVKRLTDNRDASIKQRAAKLFAAAMPADRAKALADYQPVLALKGDAAKGQVVFEKNCAACHRINGIGVNVAPDISDSRTKKFEQILADILQPNRAIDNNYLGYTVRQLDGTVLTGILAAETATSITLKQQGGKEAVIPRAEIDELKSNGQSLMPEGLERQIPQADMADLLSFIKNWRYLDGRTPLSDGNQ